MSVATPRDELADVRTPLLYNHWYVAGYADEFNEGLHERTLLDRSILIYRTGDGVLVALQNRCAHRSFPLSHGSREGDLVRCRYHGASYNASGEMVEFPGVAKCPRIAIRSYPMAVSGPLAWIWMGDPAAVASAELPALPFLDPKQGWTYVTGSYDFTGSWLLMAENLMDLTHIPFLHQTTFKFPRGYAETRIKMEINGDQLSYYRENPPGYQRSGFLRPDISERIEQAGFRARSTVQFISPALTYGTGNFELESPGPADQPIYTWKVVHFMTPISLNRSHYWYFFSRNYALGDSELDQKIRGMIESGFQEDRFAIELVQAMHENDRHGYSEAHFKSDAPGVAMRRLVAAMARRELLGGSRATHLQPEMS